jgi:hypothetical protein
MTLVRTGRLLTALLALSLTGCGSDAAHVVRIETFPTPEGPGPLVAALKLEPGVDVSLSEIEAELPRTLPANPTQTCKYGATVRITLAGGGTVTYGPCERPPEIERLRLALLHAANLHAPSGSVSSREWKAVLNDWYDGRIDDWHSCAAVYEARRHLPESFPVYTTIYEDLAAYARVVCSS